MVAGDLVYQGILEDRQAVAKANGDVAPEVFPCLEEQSVVPLRRMIRWQLRQGAVDVIDALFRQHAVYVAKTALLDGEQVALFVLQVADVVDEGHQEI